MQAIRQYLSDDFVDWARNLLGRWYVWVAGILASSQIAFSYVKEAVSQITKTPLPEGWTITALHSLQACVIVILLYVLSRTKPARIESEDEASRVISLNQANFMYYYKQIWVAWLLLYVTLAGFSFAIHNRIEHEFRDIDQNRWIQFCVNDLRMPKHELDLRYELQLLPKLKDRTGLPTLGSNLFILGKSEAGYVLRVIDAGGKIHADLEWRSLDEAPIEHVGEMDKSAMETTLRGLFDVFKNDSRTPIAADEETVIKTISDLTGYKDDPVDKSVKDWRENGLREKLAYKMSAALDANGSATSDPFIADKINGLTFLFKCRGLAENTVNNLQTLSMYLCYSILNTPATTLVATTRLPLPSGVVLVALTALLQLFGIMGKVDNETLELYSILSAIASGVVFALLIARLESKRFDPITFVIVALFTYAVLQTGWVLDRIPTFKASKTHLLYGCYLMLKLTFFFYVLWLLQRGHMLYYFHKAVVLARNETAERDRFLERLMRTGSGSPEEKGDKSSMIGSPAEVATNRETDEARN